MSFNRLTGPCRDLLALAAALGCAAGAAARDPMSPPPEAQPPAPRASAADGSPVVATARHILIVDGKRYVVDAGRRRAVGDLLGGARIERIEENAVVVREAGALHRLPLYAGVIKRPSIDGLPIKSASPAASAPRTARLDVRSPIRSIRSGETQ